jgi:protein-tyrosine phosphatase
MLPIDFLPDSLVADGVRARASALIGRGRLAMARAPGWLGDLHGELAQICAVGIGSVLALVEDKDISFFGIAESADGYVAAVAGAGLVLLRYPIPDHGVPASLADFVVAITSLNDRLRAGESVLVHCAAGIGRTGLVAACSLVALGARVDEAVAIVRATNPFRIETDGQLQFVEEFGLAVQDARLR